VKLPLFFLSLALISSLLWIIAYPGWTTPPTKSPPTPNDIQAQTYHLTLVWLVDGKVTRPYEYVFVINNAVGYKSVAALENSITHFPPGSSLVWSPSDCRTGDEPLLSSQTAMQDFKAFCAKAKVKSILVPSG